MEDGNLQSNSRIIGSSRVIKDLKRQIELLASSDVSVLITGESGAGKDLAARAIHDGGQRSRGPFVAVNCSALNAGILESELFGHCRGAFTGAVRSHAGFFEQAHGGTLFLDEIGEMPGSVQAKLLRVLQTREVRRMGDANRKRVDIRLICATNADLGGRVRAGLFRQDLYYRINVIEVMVPPLRERREDIVELIRHFFRQRAGQAPGFTRSALKALTEYPWPGNVRELENEIQRLTALYPSSGVISRGMLSERIQSGGPGRFSTERMVFDAPLAKVIEELEQDILKRTLAVTNWNKSMAARKLGLSRQGLLKKIKRYGLKRETFVVGENAGEPEGKRFMKGES